MGVDDRPCLTLERTFEAPRERVFDAWVNPEVLCLWWAASLGWRGAAAEVDARPGGRYRLSMEDGETGRVHTVAGEYLDVVCPRQSRRPRLRGRRRSMSIDVQVETIVDRPRDDVAPYAMDPRNDRSWIGALTEVNVLTDGPLGAGTRVERVAQFLGKRIEYVNEIVDYAPPERLVMRSVKAPFPMAVTYEFEDTGGATRVRIRTSGDATGFYRLGGPLLARQVKRAITADLARLKRALESEQ